LGTFFDVWARWRSYFFLLFHCRSRLSTSRSRHAAFGCCIWLSSGRRLGLLLGLFKTPRSCFFRFNTTSSSLLHSVFLACSCTERVASSYIWPIHFLGSILTSLHPKTTMATLSFLLLSFCIAVALCTYGEDLTRLRLKFRDCQSLSHL
jgi:hypothetical protein